MKKRISLALVAVLLCSLLATSCGAKNDKGPSSSIDGMSGEISVQAEKAWIPYYQAAIKRVTDKYKGVKITLKEVGSFDNLKTIDKTDMSNKDVPDVFAIPADRLTTLVSKQALAAFDTPKMAEEIGGYTDFKKSLGSAFKSGDSYFAYPFNIETLIVYANKANATANGLDLSKPIDVSSVKAPETVLLPFFDYWFGVALTNSANLTSLAADGSKFTTDFDKDWAQLTDNQRKVWETFYQYWKINADAKTPLFDKEAGWGFIENAFKSGNKGCFRLGGPWEASANSALTNGGKDLEILPISQITVAGLPLKQWQGGWGIAVNARIEIDGNKMAIAKALIASIVDPKFAVDLYKATGKIMENVKLDFYQKSDLPDVDKKIIEQTLASYQLSTPRPLFTKFSLVWDTWQNAILSWNSVRPASPEASYKLVQDSFKAMMQNVGQ